ncbi:LPS export ABC transporter periplasmic protein LptC [Synechococcus sp. A10-1-5-1]|uniref:LPS export ABC transporter periplasmic protein LptC n=1 Tax=Synechococcus sp. A10-1-5-1 TaxID=2936507 RepID=UPI00200139D8|nr:LPS export ABC transporter periplasmic protein LptC [Synechococcus sp. A10-1-5-1]UPM50508.1 LPS export ABC transporter periplasmic protein LptC [Synechococcus sp. A10-1-5-1]
MAWTTRSLLIASAFLLVGCSTATRQTAQPFAFRALDLRQQDPNGAPAWELKSPEARYDIQRKLAQALKPRGTVFRRGQPSILIAAQRGTVIGDGQAIQLEGGVRITLLGNEPVEITGDAARWLPREERMVIDQRPVALDRTSRISAQTAQYFIKRDLVELRGAPVLEHWQDGRSKVSNPKAPAPLPLKVKAQWVDWKPEQGDLKAPAVIRGERFEPNASSKDQNQGVKTPTPSLVLTAQGLRGNLRQGFVDLVAPVKIRSADGKGWLDAQETRWAINDQQLSSNQPFKGQFNALQAQGDRFSIDLEKSDVKVSRSCELKQPGERLTATRCLWNWPSGRFEALDQVVLERDTYKQVTRAKRLEGKIGDDGTAVFSSPGARVNSRFTLPPKGQGGEGKKRAPAPIAF